MYVSSWEFIARPFKPEEWRKELEAIRSLTPESLIPISHAEKIYQEASGPKYLTRLPDAGHNDIVCLDSFMYREALSSFIASLP